MPPGTARCAVRYGHRMRSRLLVLGVTAVLATGGGVAISSCGSDEDAGKVDVAKAAQATSSKGTARMTMRMRMSGLGLPAPITINARGVTALGEPRSRFSMDLGPLLALVGGSAPGGEELDVVLDGADIYVKPPRLEGLTIPGGKRWLALDLEELAEAAGLPTKGLGATFNIDPAAQLRALKAAKGLEEVGKEKVDGADTTHLRGTYTVSDVIAGLPEREREDARKALRSLERLGGQKTGVNQPLRADIWIDEDGVTRRMRASSKLPAQAGTPAGSFDISYVLRDFGAKLDTSGPPASQRHDATDALANGLKTFSGR